MVTVTVASASRPPSFARNWPIQVDVPQNGTIADVKKAISLKYPQV
jgi:very-long-chain enoyl-CoA reductase